MVLTEKADFLNRGGGQAVTEAGRAQTQWEYRIMTDRGRMGRVGAAELSEAGSEGWELVAVMRDPGTGEPQVNYYFKRPKQ
jgi:hypothetical protein